MSDNSIVSKAEKVLKNWGYELIIENNENYCGKILHFNKDSKFSMHFHIKKHETWYINSGKFLFKYIDTNNADLHEIQLGEGNVVVLNPGQPHQLIALEESEIFEVSTKHYDEDSYRVFKGDSQK
jgi:mannose-6-phosphate isomerase-like protein (cupin superfamily)